MKTLQEWSGTMAEFVPALMVVAVVVVLVQLVHWLIRVRQRKKHEFDPFPAQLATLVAALITIIGLVLVLPMESATRNQLFTLLGLVLTAIIAFSSTTFASNVLAGLVVRSSRHLRPGYFIVHNDDLGRITEIGLIQTEIQTRHRNFTYLPNTTLLSEKVMVVNPEATVVSAEVSLGYDVHHTEIDKLLVSAAEKVGLEEPYVRVRGLGDFSVSYRVYGLLRETKLLIAARSDLHKAILDSLHGAEVEIVSPGFMNQRVIPADKVFIPRSPLQKVDKIPEGTENSPENIIFDKAEEAERLENLKEERAQLTEALKELEKSNDKLEGESKVQAERELVRQKKRIEVLESILSREPKKE